LTLDGDVTRLARTPPFALMPREALQLVAFSCEKRRLQDGEALFLAGDEGDAAFFLQSGAVILSGGGAGPVAAKRVEAGALIGERALYAPVTRRTDARAAGEVVVTRVPRETFRRVLTEFPEAAGKIRADLAARTRRLIDGLDAVRVRSFADPGDQRSAS
jgi:CRP-like cAMP-binding protein